MSKAKATNPVCDFPGCERRSHACKLCLAHYKQLRKGKMLTPLGISKRINRICPACQTPFVTLPSRTRTGRGVFCSKPCSDQSSRVPLEERFWRFVQKTDDCWLWTGAHGNYGFISVSERLGESHQLLAHRVSWELHHGPIPDDLWVLHNCPGGDNPLCVNPSHLWLGTPADNSQDMVAKGRHGKNACLAQLAEG